MSKSSATSRSRSESYRVDSGFGRVVVGSVSKRAQSYFDLSKQNMEETEWLISEKKTIQKISFLSTVGTQLIPVIFAVFINLLDACTFGSVFFPVSLNQTGMAIEIFLISTFVVQIILLGNSSFKSGLGTSMAENIPFIHTIALNVKSSLEKINLPEKVFPTILITVFFSTILNGVLFYIVGYFEMGNILHYFPHHVILGMTIGFGIFLLNTAIEICTSIVLSGSSSYFLALSQISYNGLCQLIIVFVIEILLRFVEYCDLSPLAVPVLMFCVPVSFYVVLGVSGVSLDHARELTWLFRAENAGAWYDTWSGFNLSLVHWSEVLQQWPTVISLAFFTLILVPIRIPSLSLITGDDVNFDEELKAQGLANIAAGLLGTPHNYLSYSNSVFYFLVGGRDIEFCSSSNRRSDHGPSRSRSDC